MPDVSRAAVVDAPLDAARGRAGLSDEEQRIWTEAELGATIGRPVELVTVAALKPQLRNRILTEAVIAA